MYAIPNSSAMDAAAGGRGPSATVLPWIVSAEPAQVQQYITELLGRVKRLIEIIDKIDDTRGSLRTAWSAGSASDAAIAKMTDSIKSFKEIAKAVQALEAETQRVALVLRMVQDAYRAVISGVNPTVVALLSNIYTRPAARALAVGTTAGLASYVSATKAALDTVGMVRLAAIAASLGTIANELESLLSAR